MKKKGNEAPPVEACAWRRAPVVKHNSFELRNLPPPYTWATGCVHGNSFVVMRQVCTLTRVEHEPQGARHRSLCTLLLSSFIHSWLDINVSTGLKREEHMYVHSRPRFRAPFAR